MTEHTRMRKAHPCVLATPPATGPRSAVILYVLGFASRGFTWVHGALFAAMISSTDALAATAILKQGECRMVEGGQARLCKRCRVGVWVRGAGVGLRWAPAWARVAHPVGIAQAARNPLHTLAHRHCTCS